jgi:alkylated DNA repair protein (DNA oxidative demethylase)
VTGATTVLDRLDLPPHVPDGGDVEHDMNARSPGATPGRATRRRGGRSRLGGVPVVLSPAATPRSGQLGFVVDDPVERRPCEVLPDVVHVPDWLSADAQRGLVDDFHEWARPPAGLRHPRVPTGHLMSVQSVCLGWHWYPYVYSRTADDTDGTPVKPLPESVVDLARAAVAAAYGPEHREAAPFAPDAAIVNLYPPGARLGLHQDGEEPSAAPVVTISLGDTCTFRLAGVDRRTGPFTDLEVRSGDLVVFGGVNRLIYHGIPKVFPDTAPEGLGLPSGRLSLTVRETGLV